VRRGSSSANSTGNDRAGGSLTLPFNFMPFRGGSRRFVAALNHLALTFVSVALDEISDRFFNTELLT
jgi:hypothetical protein